MTKVTIRRLATGVPGLDEILGGGLPQYSFNVIAGLPGCGKTTLAHQMMFAMASPDQPALYLTAFGEPPLKMLRYQQQFDFFKRTRVQSSIRYVNLSEESAEDELDRLLRRITAEVQAQTPALVFVDSFRSMVGEEGSTGQKKFQKFLQRLGMLMTSWNATTFLIGEYPDDAAQNPVFTVADGVIWLHQSVQRNSMVRKIEIMKMRGQATLPGLHTFRIGSGGIKIFPPAERAGDPGAHAPAGPDPPE
jgi:circadian clock protein KaiC